MRSKITIALHLLAFLFLDGLIAMTAYVPTFKALILSRFERFEVDRSRFNDPRIQRPLHGEPLESWGCLLSALGHSYWQRKSAPGELRRHDKF